MMAFKSFLLQDNSSDMNAPDRYTHVYLQCARINRDTDYLSNHTSMLFSNSKQIIYKH